MTINPSQASYDDQGPGTEPEGPQHQHTHEDSVHDPESKPTHTNRG